MDEKNHILAIILSFKNHILQKGLESRSRNDNYATNYYSATSNTTTTTISTTSTTSTTPPKTLKT